MGPEAQSRGVMFIDSHGTEVPLIFISEYGLNSQAVTDELWLRQRQLQEQLRQGSLDPRKPPKPWAGNIAKQKRNQKNYNKH